LGFLESGTQSSQIIENPSQFIRSTHLKTINQIPPSEYQIELSQSSKNLLKKLDMEHQAKLVKADQNQANDTDTQNTVGESLRQTEAMSKAKLKVNK